MISLSPWIAWREHHLLWSSLSRTPVMLPMETFFVFGHLTPSGPKWRFTSRAPSARGTSRPACSGKYCGWNIVGYIFAQRSSCPLRCDSDKRWTEGFSPLTCCALHRSSRQRKYWARCFHPTVMTLDMTAPQRVEGIFGVMKRGCFISRRSSFVGVKAELEKRTEKVSVTSRLWVTRSQHILYRILDNCDKD